MLSLGIKIRWPLPLFWRLRAQTMCLGSGYKHKVAKCCNPQFCPENTKIGISAFSMGICLLSVRHTVSQKRREIEQWFQRNTYRKPHYSEVQWWCDWWRHVTPKGQGCDPKNLWSSISQKLCETDSCFKLTTYRNHILQNLWSCDWWRHGDCLRLGVYY